MSIEPLHWPSREGQVVSVTHEPVGTTGISQTLICFRYSIYGYERKA
jgi:hypothetical protein